MTLTIDGKEYPCYVTMGASLRFKDLTGREPTSIGEDEVSMHTTYLWCVTQSACNRGKIQFDMSLQDFADSISPADVMAWAAATNAKVEDDAQKRGKKK